MDTERSRQLSMQPHGSKVQERMGCLCILTAHEFKKLIETNNAIAGCVHRLIHRLQHMRVPAIAETTQRLDKLYLVDLQLEIAIFIEELSSSRRAS